jgi:hypothetical protein
VFTARYALSPYIKQIRFVFKGLKNTIIFGTDISGTREAKNEVTVTPCSLVRYVRAFGVNLLTFHLLQYIEVPGLLPGGKATEAWR